MKNIYRKSIAFLLVLALAAALFAGCGQKAEPTPAVNPSVEASEAVQPAAEDPAASEQAFLGGTPWKNSNIVGNLDAEAPKLQDDFYQAVNYEYLVSHQTPGRVSDVMTQAEPRYESVMKDMINNESYQSDLMNQIRIMYNQAVDYETLLAQGTEPLKPYIQMIESAGSIEELNAVLVSEDFPFNPVFLSIVSPDGMDGENIVGIQSNLTFVDSINGGAIDYQKELNSDADLGIYLTASIPKVFNWNMVNDPATADAKNGNVVSLVKFEQQYGKEAYYGYKMSGMEYGTADSLYTSCSIDEIQEAAGNLPVKKMLEKEGRAQSSHYLVLCVDWLKTMASLYTDENLDMFKDLFVYKLVIESTAFLTPALTYASYAAMGMDTAQFYTEDAAKTTAYAAVSSPLAFSNALASIFVEETKDKGYIEALTAVTEDIINSYKDMMSNCNWSSASAKEGLLKKIENMRMNILVPDSGYADFSGVKLKTTEEGGNLLESYLTMKKYNQQQETLLIGKPASSDAAWNMMGASTVNAFYDSDTNSVNIMPGFVSDLVCDLNSKENLYAAIGTVVGHEISHGFDVMGSQYDYNGKRNAVFTGADKDAYLTRINDFNAYLSSIQIADGVQCNGELISSEATADLCGMAVVLNALKDKEGFNYEQFFATNAIMYARTMPGNVSVMLNTSDGHPQNYMRINVINQMFEEFYTTFSVTEADGMYLAPEARSTVWW